MSGLGFVRWTAGFDPAHSNGSARLEGRNPVVDTPAEGGSGVAGFGVIAWRLLRHNCFALNDPPSGLDWLC